METIVLLIIAGIAVWGVVATLTRLDSDGYGRPEIRDRVRHVDRAPLRRA